MNQRISRRQFLKLGSLALGGLAFAPVFPYGEEGDLGPLTRITINQVDVRARPSDEATIVGNRFRDQLVHVYEEVIPPDAPEFYNRLWYRVWGGYIHSAHTQIVDIALNQPAATIAETGQLGEITVPYSVAYQFNERDGWFPWRGSRLYYSTTHWLTAVTEGPDKEPWYQITSELSKGEKYFAPARHVRILPPEEFAPLSPDVPPEKKRIEVSLPEQTLRAYEYDKMVLETKISSGIPNSRLSPGQLPTATPKGRFQIYAKQPAKHMGSITGNPDAADTGGFSLPGVPWTSFFASPGGYAFHGTYWHNNFGLQMSHGCVNMRNQDAKWLFRWCTPAYNPEVEGPQDWEVTGYGTSVHVF